MNNKLYSLFIFSLSLFVFSCTNMQTEMAKKWKLTSSINPMRDTLLAQMIQEEKSIKDSIASVTDTAKLRGMNEQLTQVEFGLNLFNQNVKKLMSESFLDLKSTGDYSSNVTGDENGKWELAMDKKHIYFHPSDKNKIDTLIIKEFKAGGNLILAFDSATYLTFEADKL